MPFLSFQRNITNTTSTLLLFGYSMQSWPKMTELQLDTITGLHRYTSTPGEGRPKLPFHNDSARQSTEETYWDMTEYEYEYEDEDEGEL